MLNIAKMNLTVNCKQYNVSILFVMRAFQGWILISSRSQMNYTNPSCRLLVKCHLEDLSDVQMALKE